MPTNIKIIVSLLALALCTAVFFLDDRPGEIAPWIALALGPLMVFSIWVFPEAKGKEIRKEAAKRRS